MPHDFIFYNSPSAVGISLDCHFNKFFGEQHRSRNNNGSATQLKCWGNTREKYFLMQGL
jgi:hypothetical protein